MAQAIRGFPVQAGFCDNFYPFGGLRRTAPIGRKPDSESKRTNYFGVEA
jgi:hypothetical protein